MRRLVALIGVVACGAPAIGPVTPTATSGGPPGLTLVGGSDAAPAGSASGDPDGRAPMPPGCLPAIDAAHPAWLDLARTGDSVIACSVDATAGQPTRCWGVDVATGALTTRPTTKLPGYGYREAGGWVAAAGSNDVTVDADSIVFEGAVPAKLHDGKNAMPAAVAAVRPYLVGGTALVLGSDGLLYEYVSGKPAQPPFHAMRSGGVGVSGGVATVHEGALTRLTVMDGLSRRTTRGRARHDETCKPDDSYAPGHEPDEGSACGAHLAAHYRPYLGTTIISDGDGFLGIDARGAVFALDDKLAETSRARVAVCAQDHGTR